MITRDKRGGRIKFGITHIEPFVLEGIPFQGIDVHGINSDEALDIGDYTGSFKIYFSDGSVMYFAKWYCGEGKLEKLNGLFAAKESVWIQFVKLKSRLYQKSDEPPKRGKYRLIFDEETQDIYYEEIEDLPENVTISPVKEKIEADLNFFFKNVSLFTRYKMSGIRKVLLVGEPGTGKSSFCAEIARLHNTDYLVVFGTYLQEVIQHLQKMAYYNMRSIVILEDADSSLQNAGSSVLNFLDGMDQVVTKKGTYLIFTTNYPQKIEPRIIKRPGRIDKIFQFSLLYGEYALHCARQYFANMFDFECFEDEELEKVFEGLTGAQIKELSQACALYVVGQNQESITIETIKFVRNEMMENIKQVQSYAERTSLRDISL
jgi:ATP-dependent 26S proteasome regulatory subunit